MITGKQVDGIRNEIKRIDNTAHKAIVNIINSVGIENEEALKIALNETIKPLYINAISLSEELGRSVYVGLRVEEIGVPLSTIAGETYDEGVFSSMANTAVDKSRKGATLEEVTNIVTNRMSYEIRNGYAVTIARNAQRDPKKPRYARVPSGFETCTFCMMLASRGFVYHDGKKGQRTHNHANCDCVYVPGWGDNPQVEGYDKDAWYNAYQVALAKETLNRQYLSDMLVEYGYDADFVANIAVHAKKQVEDVGVMERLIKDINDGDYVSFDDNIITEFELSYITHQINNVFYAKYENDDEGVIYLGDYAYWFNIIEFNEYFIARKVLIDG